MTTLIVGLGNPGKEYAKSRHNFGWMAIDQIQNELGERDWSINGWQDKDKDEVISSDANSADNTVYLIKPTTLYE